jgi:uncharacterized membrane protein
VIAERTPVLTASRLLFIDMYRGLITLVMIEGHVTNATVLHAMRPTKAFHYLNLFNGMIAPSFIFIAGFALSLIFEKRWEEIMHVRKPFWMQVRRFLFVLGVGYWLHLTTWSFLALMRFNESQLLYMLRADVLQLIALSLLFTLFLAVILRNRKALMALLFFLALINVFVTPFLYDIDPKVYLPAFPAAYINVRHSALFPLFPWAAYSFLGTVIGWIYLQARKTGREKTFFNMALILGAVMLLGGFALFYVPWQYHTYADPSRSSPRHFMLKMGFIFLSLSALWFYEQRKKPKGSWLNIVGQESLFVYGLHLMIVYGCVFTAHNIARDIGPNLTFLPSFAISTVLIITMVACALIWHKLKTEHPRIAKWIFYSLCFIFFARFFLN